MKIIAKQRAAGKTTELIKIASETDGYIVCIGVDECARIASEAQDLGLKINFPITYNEFKNGEYCKKNIKAFLIDNADSYLQYITPLPIIAATVSI